MQLQTLNIVGRMANGDPIFELPLIPGGALQSQFAPPCCQVANEPAAPCECEPPSLEDLVQDTAMMAKEYGAVAEEIEDQIRRINQLILSAPVEQAMILQAQRGAYTTRLALASQGVIQLRAFAKTAQQFLA